MTTSLSELRSRIRRLLGDTAEEVVYSDELLFDAIGAAHDAILPWYPKTGQTAFVGDGSTTSYDLPSGLYAIEACVVRSTGEILPPGIFAPGKYTGAGLSATNNWIEFPSGQVSFSYAIPDDETYDMYYTCYWDKPTSNWSVDANLEPPDHLMVGILLYSAAYALLPAAIQIGEIRQFATKVDSGTPEDNPQKRNADYLLKLFTAEMNRHPKFQRSQR